MMKEKSYNMARFFDYVLIAIFLIAICVPVAVQLIGAEPDVSNDEKRKLVAIPSTPASFREVLGFPQAFTSYADDRFGLRRMFLRLGSKLRWVLGLKITPKVLFGKDGWLYLAKNNNLIEQFRGIDLFSRDELSSWVQTMISRRDWLRERGIPFILVVAPNKHTIYPEYLPKCVGDVQGKTPLDQLMEYVAYTNLDVVDLRQAVTEAKAEYQVFFKTDTHWNDMGGFTGYRKVMQHVEDYFPHVKTLGINNFSVQEVRTSVGDLTQMINLKGEIPESWLFLKRKFDSHILPNKTAGQKKVSGGVVVDTDLHNMPKAVLFSDSFMMAMKKYFSETFHRLVIVPHKGLTFDSDLIEKEKPDIVIYELVERSVRKKIPDDRRLLNREP